MLGFERKNIRAWMINFLLQKREKRIWKLVFDLRLCFFFFFPLRVSETDGIVWNCGGNGPILRRRKRQFENLFCFISQELSLSLFNCFLLWRMSSRDVIRHNFLFFCRLSFEKSAEISEMSCDVTRWHASQQRIVKQRERRFCNV